MKRLTGFLQKAKGLISKEYLVYTGLFFLLMAGLYAYMIYAGMASAPKFAYAEF